MYTSKLQIFRKDWSFSWTAYHLHEERERVLKNAPPVVLKIKMTSIDCGKVCRRCTGMRLHLLNKIPDPRCGRAYQEHNGTSCLLE